MWSNWQLRMPVTRTIIMRVFWRKCWVRLKVCSILLIGNILRLLCYRLKCRTWVYRTRAPLVTWAPRLLLLSRCWRSRLVRCGKILILPCRRRLRTYWRKLPLTRRAKKLSIGLAYGASNRFRVCRSRLGRWRIMLILLSRR